MADTTNYANDAGRPILFHLRMSSLSQVQKVVILMVCSMYWNMLPWYDFIRREFFQCSVLCSRENNIINQDASNVPCLRCFFSGRMRDAALSRNEFLGTVHAVTEKLLLGRIASTACEDATYCYRCSVMVCVSVCPLDTTVCPAKMAKPIEMPFGGVELGGPKERRGPEFPSFLKGHFWGWPVRCGLSPKSFDHLFFTS